MDNNEELVVIREYDSITRAETAKSLLESEGIFATIRNEYMSAIYPVGTMPAQIVVREEDDLSRRNDAGPDRRPRGGRRMGGGPAPLDGRRRRR